MAESSTDFTKLIALRLRETDAIGLELSGKVPSVSVWFETGYFLSDVELNYTMRV